MCEFTVISLKFFYTQKIKSSERNIKMYKITSRFMQQESFRKYGHSGIDFSMEYGEPLRAIKSGIIHIKDFGNFNAGKTVLIESDGKFYIYGHLSKFANIKEGQHVNVGDLIGYAGNSGFSTGTHLHFGIREGNRYLDPSPYIEHIQNMNNPTKLQALVQKAEGVTHSTNISFSDIVNGANIYQELFNSIKLNIIHLVTSIDYSVVIQYFKHLFQFFS